jgi:hypothetical protein
MTQDMQTWNTAHNGNIDNDGSVATEGMEKLSIFVLLMSSKQSLAWLNGKRYSTRAVSVSARMRTTVLTRGVRGVCVHPRFLRI